MTLRQFAAAIGRSMDTISKWENGHRTPRRGTRRRLIDWLGSDPEAIHTRAALLEKICVHLLIVSFPGPPH